MMDYRKAYGLPERYFLSLGRMVEKKNLSTIVEAYARYAEGVAVAGERLKVKGNDGEKQGDRPGGLAAPQQAEGSEVVTSHQVGRCSDLSPQTPVPATRYSVPALVFVGSGELEGALREQARSLGLRVVERTDWRVEKTGHSRATRDGARRSREQIDPEPWKDFSHGLTRINTDASERLAADRTKGNAASSVTRAGCGLSPETTSGEDAAAMKARDLLPATRHEENRGTVFFYGFRQIEENPVFYALAEAFVLPSLKEEWGLVVNEAMACSLPVIVSRTAGCAEDLLPGSESWQCSVGSIQFGENADADDCQLKTENSLEERSNGFVFDPSSVDALSEALRRIAEGETADGGDAAATLKAEMGRRSREIVAKFGCENFARQALSAARASQKA